MTVAADILNLSQQWQASAVKKSLQMYTLSKLLSVWRIYTVNQKKTWQFIVEYNFG